MLPTGSCGSPAGPVRCEFDLEPGRPAEEWEHDWLVVHGQVGLRDGVTWSFDDPCLTTWEAAELCSWLRAAARGEVPVSAEPPLDDDDRLLAFTEPNLAFSVAPPAGADVVVRLHLSLEALPPATSAALHAFHVPLRVPPERLLEAADDWERDLQPFAQR